MHTQGLQKGKEKTSSVKGKRERIPDNEIGRSASIGINLDGFCIGIYAVRSRDIDGRGGCKAGRDD